MKLPKQYGNMFGGGGMGDMLKQAQAAMDQAKNLEEDLAKERFEIAKNGVTVTFDGRGAVQGIKIDQELVDPEDVETLEDVITAAARDGFEKATEMRASRVEQIMPNMPNIPGLF